MTNELGITRRGIVVAGAASAAAAGLGMVAPAQAAPGPSARPSPEAGAGADGHGSPLIVLVHGAFADGSSWAPVARRLQDAGHRVRVVANPLRGLPVDAAHVRSVLDAVTGPVVLAGHSYGGAVITEAAAGAAQVKALVYVAAFVPDAGEVLGELAARFPGSELEPALVPVPAPAADGTPGADLYIREDRFRRVFAGDVREDTARLLAAGQRPLSASAFGDRVTAAAWRTIPSWNLVATLDRGIPPELQRFQARRAGSHTVSVPSSHLPLHSRPGDVAGLIRAAARTVA
ncbi:alpha/beta fold hydrolase [Streptomyces sp. NPDC002640]